MGRQGWAALEVTSHYSCSHSPDLSIHLSKDNQIVNYPCIGLEKVISKSHPPLDIFFKKEKINVELKTTMAVSTHQPQQYCLRWNNHQHNLLSVFEDLLNHEAFVDVTISCYGLNLKAHKMVLSACSPSFQSMFYNTPDKHPIVFLKDVRYDEMKALLEFMYRGEVSVDQENLSSLLKVAESLKIKGLADVNESQSGMSAPRLPLPMPISSQSSNLHGFHAGLLSPDGSLKRLHAATSPSFLGPKRKRGRPRRLSGSEAVPLALSIGEQDMEERARSESRSSPLPLDISESEQSPLKSLKEGSRAMSLSPGDLKANDFHSEADSNDGRSSGLLMT